MYEYEPKPKKTREKLLAATSIVLAAACFGVAAIPELSYLFIYQLLMVIFLVCAISIITRYLMRSYVYRVAPRENALDGAPSDFTVTESYAGKLQTVCRVSVTDILEIRRVTKENGRELRTLQKGKRVYSYVEEMRPSEACLLTVRDGEDVFFVRICANDVLFSALLNHEKQFLSDS